jgi:hypothetical protein
LEPLSPEEVADRTIFASGPKDPTQRRFPFPTSGSASSKGKAWNETASSLRSIVLSTEVLPPHKTIHGFLFFDVSHQFDAVRHSHLYIPDLG